MRFLYPRQHSPLNLAVRTASRFGDARPAKDDTHTAPEFSEPGISDNKRSNSIVKLLSVSDPSALELAVFSGETRKEGDTGIRWTFLLLALASALQSGSLTVIDVIQKVIPDNFLGPGFISYGPLSSETHWKRTMFNEPLDPRLVVLDEAGQISKKAMAVEGYGVILAMIVLYALKSFGGRILSNSLSVRSHVKTASFRAKMLASQVEATISDQEIVPSTLSTTQGHLIERALRQLLIGLDNDRDAPLKKGIALLDPVSSLDS